MFCTSKVIILRTTKYRDSDLIINSLSESGSTLSFMARGARKSKKRFTGGVLEPTHFVKVTYQNPKHEEGLGILSEVSLLESFSSIRKSYEKVEASAFFLKTVSKISRQGTIGSQGVFLLLGQTLRALEETLSIENLKIHFLSRLLEEQGVFPKDVDKHLLKIHISQHDNIHNHYGSGWLSYSQIITCSIQNYLG